MVRSKSEVIVADTLTQLGISYEYEQKLPSKDDPNDYRLPDFTVSYEGDTFYWEHLGMLSVPSYKEAMGTKAAVVRGQWLPRAMITSEDGADGGIDAAEIERIARKQILMESRPIKEYGNHNEKQNFRFDAMSPLLRAGRVPWDEVPGNDQARGDSS